MENHTSKAVVVVFNGIKFRRYPNARSATHRNYFKPGQSHVAKGVGALHVEVWKSVHGPVPDGHEIHHIDGDSLNNDPSNLECVTREVHMRKHFTSPARMERARKHIDDIRPLASAWHQSEEAKEFHKRIGKASWEGREPRELVCQECGEKYSTLRPGESFFCSNKCKSMARRKSGVDDIDRVCPVCNAAFRSNKYRGSETCSAPCSIKNRPPRK